MQKNLLHHANCVEYMDPRHRNSHSQHTRFTVPIEFLRIGPREVIPNLRITDFFHVFSTTAIHGCGATPVVPFSNITHNIFPTIVVYATTHTIIS